MVTTPVESTLNLLLPPTWKSAKLPLNDDGLIPIYVPEEDPLAIAPPNCKSDEVPTAAGVPVAWKAAAVAVLALNPTPLEVVHRLNERQHRP